MNSLIRWFSSDDVTDIVSIHEECGRHFEDLDITCEYVRAITSRPDFRIACACEAGKVVGFAGVLYHETVSRAEFGPLAISGDFRRKGIGKELAGFVFDFLGSMGVRRVTALVKAENREGMDFFLSMGFQLECLRREYTRSGEDAIQLVTFLY
ncbi:GNAT family N-acetyltransferase [Candidatus Altiarchaeota archaeon]